MKIRSAIFLMLAGMAGGIGGRLAFTSPADEVATRRGGGAGDRRVSQAEERAAEVEVSLLRPEAAAVLTARGGSRLRLLMAWLPGAGENDLLRMAAALTGPEQDENLSIRLLMARWAEVNPAAMLTWARQQRYEGWGAGFYTNNAIESWARVDFDSAWSAARDGLLDTRASALLGLTAVDPDKCLSLLRADPSLMDLKGFTYMGKVLARIAARDPAGAASLLDNGPAARLSKFAGNVALAWAKSDPAAAVEWMQRLDPGVRATSLQEAAKWIAGHASEELPALLEGLPAGLVRTKASAEGFAHLSATDPAAARRQLDAMPASPSRQFSRGLLMRELFRSGDEAGAIALASQLGWQLDSGLWPGSEIVVTPGSVSHTADGDDGGNSIQTAMKELMGRIAARNPQEAAAILAKCPADAAIRWLIAENVTNRAALAAALLASSKGNAPENCQFIVGAWSAREPAAAAAWVVSHVDPGDDRHNMLARVITNWAADPPLMLQWAATVDADTVQAAWFQVVSGDHTYAAAHLDEFFAVAQPAAVAQLLRRAESTPEIEREVLRQMPDEMDVGIQNAVNRWVAEQPGEATEWVRGLPPGVRRTNATKGVVSSLSANGDHEGAFAWALTLPEENRAEALTKTLEPWGRADAAAAEAAIRASALPPEKQQTLLDTLPPP